MNTIKRILSPTDRSLKIGIEHFQCNLMILDCIYDKNLIEQLKLLAQEQKSNFSRIYPWERKCKKGDKIFVAIDQNILKTIKKTLQISNKPLICGWASVSFMNTLNNRNKNNQKFVYINEISASNNREKFKGIGTDIIKEIEKEDIDFIELTPLSTAVSFYEKIGFYQDKRISKMFKVIRKPPLDKYIELLIEKEEERKRLEKEDTQEILDEILDELSSDEQDAFNKFLHEKDYHLETILDVYHNVPEESRIEEIIKLIS
jgi:hypothetical protein